MPVWIALPDMTISQSRMVLAMTGIRPTEKMTISAAITQCQFCVFPKNRYTTYFSAAC